MTQTDGGKPLLDCRGLEITFNPGVADARKALDGLDFVLAEREFAVAIGSNGAGKSTLLNAIAGSVSLDRGTIRLGDRDLTRLAPYRRAGLITRVFQDPMSGTAAGMTIEENLALAEQRGRQRGFRAHLNPSRRDRYRDLLRTLSLGLEDRLTTQVALLSGGQRQALSLLMALISKPRLLLLDEHTAALDPRTADIVMQATLDAVRQTDVATIMITHNMRHAIETGTRLVMMDAGRVVYDVSGAEKNSLTPEALVERFKIDNDRMRLNG